MDPSQLPPGEPPPRRELQSPRPSPLNVRKGSHAIKKPPLAPAPQPSSQHRPPVIIYAVPPKVIHVHPSEFRSTVQRLTGPGASSSSAPHAGTPPSSGCHDVHMVERAAGMAATSVEAGRGAAGSSMSEGAGAFSVASFLSSAPAPSSLPAVSPSMLSSFQEMSSTSSISDSNLLCSPSGVVSAPALSSPGAYWELFNQTQDL